MRFVVFLGFFERTQQHGNLAPNITYHNLVHTSHPLTPPLPMNPRSAQEVREQAEVESKVRQDMIDRGEQVPSKKKSPWDSNVITPGTDFMIGLSNFIRYYIRCRISGGGEFWKNLTVVFSDASVPGEGEHKIMAYVRRSRIADGADVNTKHVLHGLDADLIMLGLATHEVNFFILREEVLFGRKSAENMQRVKDGGGWTERQKELDEQDRQVSGGRGQG